MRSAAAANPASSGRAKFGSAAYTLHFNRGLRIVATGWKPNE